MNSRLARIITVGGFLLGLGSGAGAWAQSGASALRVSSIYTCIDKQGRKLTSDRPIPECLDREQRELGPSGTVRRVVGPTLTDYERNAQEAQRRKDREERMRLVEERRRERVLTTRYPDKATHDIERAAAIALIDDVSAVATQHIQMLRGQRQTLDVEMEFYRSNPSKAPVVLRRQLAENDEGIQDRQRFLATQAQEKRRIHQRFDVELAQLQRLWAQQKLGLDTVPEDDTALTTPGR